MIRALLDVFVLVLIITCALLWWYGTDRVRWINLLLAVVGVITFAVMEGPTIFKWSST